MDDQRIMKSNMKTPKMPYRKDATQRAGLSGALLAPLMLAGAGWDRSFGSEKYVSASRQYPARLGWAHVGDRAVDGSSPQFGRT